MNTIRKNSLLENLNLKNISFEQFQFFFFYNNIILWDYSIIFGLNNFTQLNLKGVNLKCNLRKGYKNDLSIYIKMQKMLQCFGKQKALFLNPNSKSLSHFSGLVLNLRKNNMFRFIFLFLFYIKPIIFRKRMHVKYRMLFGYNNYIYSFSMKELNHFVDFFKLINYDYYNIFVNIFFRIIFLSNKFIFEEILFILKYLRLKT